MQGSKGAPVLRQLMPYHGFEPSHQRYVPLSRFHGSQRLNLMRPTRMPANSRRYNHGDPVHLIDWRAFARSEQLVIREQNDEASCRIALLIDDQASLDWPDAPIKDKLGQNLCTKRELIWRVALHLSYQSLKWGDTVRLYRLHEEKAYSINLRSQVDAAMLFETLAQQDFKVPKEMHMESKSIEALRSERSDLLYWLSDGFEGIPPWLLQKKGPYACWIQVLSSLEIDPSWLSPGDSYFDESHTLREFMGAALVQDRYLQKAVQRWQDEISLQWLGHHKHHVLVTDETPIQGYMLQLEKPWGSVGRGRSSP